MIPTKNSRPPRTTRTVLLAVSVAVLGTACSPNGKLAGSLAESYNLTFDRVRGYVLGSRLVLIYERDYQNTGGQGSSAAFSSTIVNQVIRISLDSQQQPLSVGSPIIFDLTSEAPGIVVEHYVLAPGATGSLVQEDQFPDLVAASVQFSHFSLAKSGHVQGRFNVTFANQENAQGDFDVTLSSP